MTDERDPNSERRETKLILGIKSIALLVVAAAALVTTAPAVADGNVDAVRRCQNDAWRTLMRADGTPFANLGECVSYAAQGGAITVVPVVDVFFVLCPEYGPASMCAFATAAGLDPGSTLQVTVSIARQGDDLDPIGSGYAVNSDGIVEQTAPIIVTCSSDAGDFLALAATAVGTAPDGATVTDTETTVLACE